MIKIVRHLGTIDRQLGKYDILELASENANTIINTKYDLLKVYVELKRYETYLKGLIDNLKGPAYEKAALKRNSAFDYDDARIYISKRTKWDFSVDEQWTRLDTHIQQLMKERRERETQLKEANKAKVFTDQVSGEIIEDFELPVEIKYGLSVHL